MANREDTNRSPPLLKQRSRRMLHQDNAEHNFFCNAPGETEKCAISGIVKTNKSIYETQDVL